VVLAYARADVGLEMILGLAYLLCLLSVPLARGRLSALAELELRRPWLVLAAIGIQVAIISVVPGPVESAGLGEPLHIVSYCLLAAFAWANRRVAGVPVIALGGFCNVLAITVNGGVMPADPDALAAAGKTTEAGEFINSAAVQDPKLGFLGDIIATPASLPVSNVYSVGDILILLGAFVLLHVVCGSRLVPRRFRSRARGGAQGREQAAAAAA
jgi:hypothetical protein